MKLHDINVDFTTDNLIYTPKRRMNIKEVYSINSITHNDLLNMPKFSRVWRWNIKMIIAWQKAIPSEKEAAHKHDRKTALACLWAAESQNLNNPHLNGPIWST